MVRVSRHVTVNPNFDRRFYSIFPLSLTRSIALSDIHCIAPGQRLGLQASYVLLTISILRSYLISRDVLKPNLRDFLMICPCRQLAQRVRTADLPAQEPDSVTTILFNYDSHAFPSQLKAYVSLFVVRPD